LRFFRVVMLSRGGRCIGMMGEISWRIYEPLSWAVDQRDGEISVLCLMKWPVNVGSDC
jgi:hypothetical protein